MMNKPRDPENFNTYGLSLQFLDSINVQPPLVKKVFVANVSIIFKNFFKTNKCKLSSNEWNQCV